MKIEKNVAIEAATDGACSGNPGPGGWGGLIIFDDKSEIEIGGAEKNTTNNRMELTAAIKTIEKLKNFQLKDNFKLKTDSKYVIEGYTKWVNNWKKNGWKTSAGKPVQNSDLWKEIDKLRIKGLNMEFIKGHSGDKNNERVDLIATNYSKGIALKNNSKEPLKLENEDLETIAPSEIQKLFSRINLIEKFVLNEYLLTSKELHQLFGITNNKSIEKHELFEWRNWKFLPQANKYWLIEKKTEHKS